MPWIMRWLATRQGLGSGMRRSRGLIIGVAFALLATSLAGCDSGSKTVSGTPSATPPTALQTELAVATADATIAAQYGTPTVHVTEVPGGTRILTDDAGRTLYFFSDDVPAAGVSQCTGECARTWPPLELGSREGFQIAGLGIFGTFQRPDDGGRQLMYRGRPLYRYSGDTSPGDSTGDGVDGKWSVAVP